MNIFSPVLWLLLLLLAGLLLRKKSLRRLCLTLAVILFLVFSSPALFQWYARWYQPGPVTLLAGQQYHAGIVAGGFGSVDASGAGYFNPSSDRFLQAVRLYKLGHIKRILVSGGNSRERNDGFGEGRWAREQMIQFGIPASDILVEDQSKNTRDNAANSKHFLDSLGIAGPYLLISSAFHLPRAQQLYRDAGLDVDIYPCNYTAGRGPIMPRDWIPSVNTLSSWPPYVKEAVGRAMGR